jgi:hypothetical protein
MVGKGEITSSEATSKREKEGLGELHRHKSWHFTKVKMGDLHTGQQAYAGERASYTSYLAHWGHRGELSWEKSYRQVF